MLELVLSIILFTVLVLVLTSIILFVRARVIESGNIDILVNDKKTIQAFVGDKLLYALAGANIFLPSSCSGRGTCGQCKVIVNKGGGAALPTETALLNKKQLREKIRLACQVTLKLDTEIIVPDVIMGVRKWQSIVRSNQNVSTFIKELILELPKEDPIDFKAGGYIILESPPYNLSFRDFDIEPQYHNAWDRHNLWQYTCSSKIPVQRAYSMANYPAENDIVMLNVRIAIPPPGAGKGILPGIVSSWIFSLKPGDSVEFTGPFGHFFAKETEKEMIFIGGGAGMAPIRSHILDQLKRIKTRRKISFWYGARNSSEVFYQELFDSLQTEYYNFEWYIALSDPVDDNNWMGLTGLIHKVIYNQYLKDHPAPEDCEYYLCGPPMMTTAVISMLDELGVDKDNILFDDFGS
jgi:Na+-transporting NADH:ubiquinone oxidoreductase subunit F